MQRVIIVDDKEQDRYLLEVLLKRSGYDVDTAGNGADALSLARKNPPDMIVSDILMPVMDGFALCREWRKDPQLSSIPFVYYTATYTDPRDEDFALQLGADRFILKPEEPVQLLETLEGVLSGNRNLPKPAALPADDEQSGQYFKMYSEVLVRKLEDKFELFQAIFNVEPCPLFLLSTSHAILEMNRSAKLLFGHKGQEAFDTAKFEELIPVGYRADFSSRISGVADGEVLHDHECAVMAADGTARILLWSAQRILRSSGVIDGVLLIGNDITERRRVETERKEIERQLHQAQKMEAIGQLASGVAHDFNNYLSAVMGFCDLVKLDAEGNSMVEEKIDQIMQCSVRAAGLTRQLLAFSRKQMLEPMVMNLNTIIADMEPMLRRLLGEHIKLNIRYEPDLETVKADPGQMEQVFMNLSVNARDAMPEGGILSIETGNTIAGELFTGQSASFSEGRCVMIAVGDTGIGMDDKTKARIFEPFFTTKEIGKGTGLGLSTVYGIIKQSGGTVDCSSEPGKGTTFRVCLPVSAANVQTEEGEKRPVTSTTGTETVLVVEDEEMVRGPLVKMLKRAGYQVISAANGENAIAAARDCEERVQLLLTDMVMPGMNGKILATHLLKTNPTMKTLFISGYSDELIGRDDTGNGNVFLLPKPFNMATLLKKIREVLDG